MLSGEARNTNFIVFGLTRLGLEPALEASTLTSTPPMHFFNLKSNITTLILYVKSIDDIDYILHGNIFSIIDFPCLGGTS